MALILTLIVVALLTIMIVSFVSVASKDLTATQSYAQSLRAQEIGLGGLDKVVSQLRAEITDPANSTLKGSASSAIYIPINNTNAVPQRMVTGTLSPLLTVSGSNVYNQVSGSDLASTGSLSTAPSLNGRSVSTTRWNMPQFFPTASSSSFPAPNWVIVTRSGPQTISTSPAQAHLTGLSLVNMNAAVGRYAYAVYDTSGLIDINAAGYPSSASSSASIKGEIPWADLTQLTNTIQQSDVDNLVNWRNASETNYAQYVTNTWVTNGFMRVAPGDSTFLSRQDLIKYVQTQNSDLTGALPYLTTFSREANGPTWQPTNPPTAITPNPNYTTSRYTTGVTNPAIFNPQVLQTFVRNNGTTAVVGEPLVKYRFPLNKLALLEKQGTVGLTAQDKSDILKYFGLILASDSSGLYRHWIYTNPQGSTSTTGATTILPLDTVATKGREPDFFELLQAGILSGSLAKIGRADDMGPAGRVATVIDTDGTSAYQIIRIGANIIDQWDADNYPTTVTFNSMDFYGIEDLPYINTAFLKANAMGSTPLNASAGVPGLPFAFYLYFELWNPHQQIASTSTYPTQFRIAPLSGDNFHFGVTWAGGPIYANWYYNNGWAPSTATQYFSTLSQPTGGIMTFTASPSSFREPALIPGSTAAWPNGPAIVADLLGTFSSFPLDQTPSSSPTPTATPTPGTYWDLVGTTYTAGYFVAHLTTDCPICGVNGVFPLQYKDPSGAWRTYSTFQGTTSLPGTTNPSETGDADVVNLIPTAPGSSANTVALAKSDPRTYRLGPAAYMPTSGSFGNSAGVNLTPNATTLNRPTYGHYIPFDGGPPTGVALATPYRVDMWTVNDNSPTAPAIKGGYYSGTPASSVAGASSPYYTDNDGVMRAGDARNSYPTTSPLFTGANTARPVMLNRPFHSVGELGYAFRDMPWKTLDLSTANSADAGLLDLFGMTDAPLVAGRVNPNTAPAPVLTALLAGAQANTYGSTTLSTSTAQQIAAAVNTAASSTPFLNRSELASTVLTNAAVASAFPTGIKAERESVVRALAEAANTRTWNFLIDIVAQSGTYPATATTLDNFTVTGERRYWLHVAIDRYTGQVVDKQLEAVNQ